MRATPELHAVHLAEDPARWLADYLPTRYEDDPTPAEGGRLVSMAEVLADDAALLRTLHATLTGDGVPAPAAATYLAGWFAGSLASAVGFALAAGGAGFAVRASEVRWYLHPGGWPERVELGDTWVLVPSDHLWARPSAADVLGTEEILSVTVGALVEVVTPLIAACRTLANVGTLGLWNEVADGLGTAVAHQVKLPVTPGMVAVLDAAVRVAGVPWKAFPALRFAESSFGRVHVAQKGGCCLAYTRTDWPAEDQAEGDPDPTGPDNPRYCSTCPFRDAAESDARQVLWLERVVRERTTS